MPLWKAVRWEFWIRIFQFFDESLIANLPVFVISIVTNQEVANGDSGPVNVLGSYYCDLITYNVFDPP
jgi:hypothetical protein